jgi:hypothetical protein
MSSSENRKGNHGVNLTHYQPWAADPEANHQCFLFLCLEMNSPFLMEIDMLRFLFLDGKKVQGSVDVLVFSSVCYVHGFSIIN